MKVFQAIVECPSCGHTIKVSNSKAAEILYDMYHIKLFECHKCQEVHTVADALSFTNVNEETK